MENKIKDLTREFSEIEQNIIREFIDKITPDKAELNINTFGRSVYDIYLGMSRVEIELFISEDQDNPREIIITAYEVPTDPDTDTSVNLLSEGISNPSELSSYLKMLSSKLLITE